MFSMSQNSSVIIKTFGYIFFCAFHSRAGLCEIGNFPTQKSRQVFILYCSFSPLFPVHHSSCSVKYICLLSTQSLTALVCDKADIFILPPPHLILQDTPQYSSGRHSLNEKSDFASRVCASVISAHSQTVRRKCFISY